MELTDAIHEIKQRINLADLVSSHGVRLKKMGHLYKGCCPFHSEKSPSFTIWGDENKFYCFGCRISGDIFDYLEMAEGLSKNEARISLASQAGVELPNKNLQEIAEQELVRKIIDLNTITAGFYSSILYRNMYFNGQIARDYLTSRNINSKSAKLFGLGYSPSDTTDGLIRFIRAKTSYTVNDLMEAGLVGRTDEGRYYDFYRGRITFPIRSISGEIVSFSGRTIINSKAKYLNGRDTPAFDKGGLLYGLDLAKGAIRTENHAIVVEGPIDVISAHQNGYTNLVAPMGTALTERQVKELKRFTRRVTLALDGDKAGALATQKGISTVKSSYERTAALSDPHGMVTFEQRSDVDLKVLILPAGSDPASILRASSSAWEKLLNEAMPPLDYYFEVAKTTYDLKSARGKQQTLEKLAPLLLEISLPLPREHYLTKLSELTGISTTTIEAALSEISSNHPIKHPDKLGDQPRDDSNSILARMEDALMIDLLAYFPMSLTYPSSDGNVVKSSDFDHPDNSLIFEKLAILAAEWLPIEALGEALALASDSLSLRYSYLQLLAAQTPEIDDPNEAAELIQYKLDKLRKGNFQKTYNSLVEHLEGIEQKAEVEDSDLEEIVEVASMANNIRDLILQYS